MLVQDLMVTCVEQHFGSLKTPHPVGLLSDNGSTYIAGETRNSATAFGLRLCFTPVRSPQTDHIAEAFVKTFRRDYLHLSILPAIATVLTLLRDWFDDHNNIHPHSVLCFQACTGLRSLST